MADQDAGTPDRMGALVEELRARHPIVATLDLAFADCGVRLESSTAQLVEMLAVYYREFLGEVPGATPIVVTALEGAPPDLSEHAFGHRPLEAGKRRLKEEFLDLDGGRIVRKLLTGMHFLMRGDDHVAIGPCIENDNQIVNFINNRHIQWLLHRGALLTHAAAISHGGRGLAFAGFSGMGKSTLALHLMSRGVTLVSNDRVLVRREEGRLRIHGVAKHPRINPGTALHNPDLASVLAPEDRERFLALDPHDLWHLEHKHDALTDECFGPHRFALDASLEGFVVLNWQRGGGAADFHEVDIDARRDLLRAIMKPTGVFYTPGPGMPTEDPDEDAYIARLAGCRVYEISGGTDFDAAADRCLALLASA